MSQVTVTDAQAEVAAAASPAPDTFTFTTKRGDVIVAGKPRGVLKLKLRNILSLEELDKDHELTQIATAVLSIRTVNGEVPKCATTLQFQAVVQNLFADDTDLDSFMNQFQRFTAPEYTEFIEATLQEAAEQGILDPDDVKAFMTKKLLERAQVNQDKVRLS